MGGEPKSPLYTRNTHANCYKRATRAHNSKAIPFSIYEPYWFIRLYGARALQLQVLAMTERALVLRVSSPAETGARHNFYFFPPFICNYLQKIYNDTRSSTAKRSRNPRTRICKGMTLSQTNSARFRVICHSLCDFFFVRNRAEEVAQNVPVFTWNVCLQTESCKATSRAVVHFSFAGVQPSIVTLGNVYEQQQKNLRSSDL